MISMQAADIIENLENEIERLKRENFSLASGQCIVVRGLLGDEHGHQYCALQKEIELLKEGFNLIRNTEDSYDDEQVVLSEIYLICEKHIDERA